MPLRSRAFKNDAHAVRRIDDVLLSKMMPMQSGGLMMFKVVLRYKHPARVEALTWGAAKGSGSGVYNFLGRVRELK